MGLETGSFISDLVITNPTGSDAKSTADDHLRLIKKTVTQTFPNIAGEVSASHAELNALVGISTTSSVEARLTKYSASISALNTAVSANSDSISAINTTISGITTTLTNYGDSISALNTAVATHDDSISALNTAIANRLSADATAVAAIYAKSASEAARISDEYWAIIDYSGTDVSMPSGWSATFSGGGNYTLNHNLSSSLYSVIALAEKTAAAAPLISVTITRTLNAIELLCGTGATPSTAKIHLHVKKTPN